MNTELSPRDIVKDEAYGLAHELLARTGFRISRTKSLDAIAISCGYKNWNVLSAMCYQGIEFSAVIVDVRHAECLAGHLHERHGIDIAALECTEILQRISQQYSEVLRQHARHEEGRLKQMHDGFGFSRE